MPSRSRPAPAPQRRSDRTNANVNHHLWQHGKQWWVYCAVNPTPRTKDKLRRSLSTECVKMARFRRDELFRRLHAEGMLGRMRLVPMTRRRVTGAPGNEGQHNWKPRVDEMLRSILALDPSPAKKLPVTVVGTGQGRLQLCCS